MDKFDYTDPICPFDASMWTGAPQEMVPVRRVMDKSDELLSRDDFSGAEKHLLYWLKSAEAFRDIRGAFFLHNELIGFYRKTGNEARALEEIAAAFSLTEDERIGKDNTGFATLCVNAATAKKAFGRSEEALPLFTEAKRIYERELKPDDRRLGGLYNNMALSYADLGEWDDADAYFLKAIEVMSRVEHGELEQAISYLNLADIQAEDDPKIEEYLDKAEALLDTESLPRDSYYAFVADKCAPVFDGYQRQEYAQKLRQRKKEITGV